MVTTKSKDRPCKSFNLSILANETVSRFKIQDQDLDVVETNLVGQGSFIQSSSSCGPPQTSRNPVIQLEN
jgi:hypothetical protein